MLIDPVYARITPYSKRKTNMSEATPKLREGKPLRTSYEIVKARLDDADAADPTSQGADLSPDDNDTSTPPDQLDDIDTQPDAEVLYTDAEILGGRYQVLQVINELGNQRMRVIEDIQAKWRNTLDTPGKLRLGLSQALAESGYYRHKAKLHNIQQLDDGPLKRARMRARTVKLAKAETKFSAAKAAYGGRQERMQQRTTTVREHTTQRRDDFTAELREHREQALAKRSVRRELHSEGAGRLEARSIVKTIPKEHLDRVGKLAGVAFVSEQSAAKASKVERKSSQQDTQTSRDIATNRKRTEAYAGEAKRANETLDEIRTINLPAAEKHLEDIRSELDQIADDDPVRAGLATQIDEAEHQIAIYTEREIPYWQRIAEDNRKHAIALTAERASLQSELRRHKEVSAVHSEAADEKRTATDQHAAARSAAINEILFDQ